MTSIEAVAALLSEAQQRYDAAVSARRGDLQLYWQGAVDILTRLADARKS